MSVVLPIIKFTNGGGLSTPRKEGVVDERHRLRESEYHCPQGIKLVSWCLLQIFH